MKHITDFLNWFKKAPKEDPNDINEDDLHEIEEVWKSEIVDNYLLKKIDIPGRSIEPNAYSI